MGVAVVVVREEEGCDEVWGEALAAASLRARFLHLCFVVMVR